MVAVVAAFVVTMPIQISVSYQNVPPIQLDELTTLFHTTLDCVMDWTIILFGEYETMPMVAIKTFPLVGLLVVVVVNLVPDDHTPWPLVVPLPWTRAGAAVALGIWNSTAKAEITNSVIIVMTTILVLDNLCSLLNCLNVLPKCWCIQKLMHVKPKNTTYTTSSIAKTNAKHAQASWHQSHRNTSAY